MAGAQLYDTIGATYTVTRRTEPRIAEQFWAALGDARTVLNVGAGTGSYEPTDRDVLAVELVGVEHVGVSTDYPFDAEDLRREMVDNPHLFPESYTRWGPIDFIAPEEFLGVGAALRERGYPDDAVTAILGGNFRRVAAAAWAAA